MKTFGWRIDEVRKKNRGENVSKKKIVFLIKFRFISFSAKKEILFENHNFFYK